MVYQAFTELVPGTFLGAQGRYISDKQKKTHTLVKGKQTIKEINLGRGCDYQQEAHITGGQIAGLTGLSHMEVTGNLKG